MKVLVSGSLAYDRIMNFPGRFGDHILPNKIHMLNVSFYVKTYRQGFGGTAGNIAYNLKLLGLDPVLLSTYGHDFSEYKKWFTENKIKTTSCKQVAKEATAVAHMITDQSDNQIAGFFPGALATPYGPIKPALLKSADVALISPGNPTDMRRQPGIFRKAKLPFFFDPGQTIPVLSKQDLLNGIRGSAGLFSNDYELAMIMKKTGYTKKKLLSLAAMLITTLGEKGTIISTPETTIKIPPAKPKNTSDPTGAGDAFRAGFLTAILRGHSLAAAGRLAGTVSVYTVEKYGTQTHRFSRASLQRRYQQNFKQKIII